MLLAFQLKFQLYNSSIQYLYSVIIHFILAILFIKILKYHNSLRRNYFYENYTHFIKLYKGSAQVVARKSPNSLYDENLATYTSADTFDQDAAIGFIKLWGLPTKVHSEVQKSAK